MRTLTASDRAVVVAAVAMALSLSLAGCSRTLGDSPGDPVACSLLFIDGQLVADNGRVVLLPGPGFAGWDPRVPLDFPGGWTVRPTEDGQLEVADTLGIVRARTGEGIVLSAVNDPAGSGVWIRDGELVVCPGQWPDNYMDPDYSPPNESATDPS